MGNRDCALTPIFAVSDSIRRSTFLFRIICTGFDFFCPILRVPIYPLLSLRAFIRLQSCS
jgi:hypothetical protein